MKILVTGSSGLIGSEAVEHFCKLGHDVIGIDNNMRKEFFGEKGDTLWNLKRLTNKYKNFVSYGIDIRDRVMIMSFFEEQKPEAIIHCAAQPSHDKAASIPFLDFEVNAMGTLNLLEATRQYCKESPFVFMSTNKVYGDGPNDIPMKELDMRYDYHIESYTDGIDESFSIDQCKHSLFGTSKVAADILVQEYGKYFNMATVCLRGGCLTGPNHSGVELHGFLSYLIKCIVHGIKYKVYGYKGKQVRDQIHSYDVVRAMEEIIMNPSYGTGEIFNIGGGKGNAASLLECVEMIKIKTGKSFDFEYVNENRIGDHICYYSNINKLKQHYPKWNITKDLNTIIDEMIEFENKND